MNSGRGSKRKEGSRFRSKSPGEIPVESEDSSVISISEEQLEKVINECKRKFSTKRAMDRQSYLKERPWLQNMKK